MKHIVVVIFALLLAEGGDAFTPLITTNGWCTRHHQTSRLQYSKPNDQTASSTSPRQRDDDVDRGVWWGPMAVALAGVTLAGQVASASPLSLAPEDSSFLLQEQQSRPSTTTLLATAVDTLDFSLPKYDDAMKGSSMKTSSSAPTFNPFGDFEPTKVESDAEASKKAEEKSAAEAKKAEEKAAAEAKKAEEKAAADAKAQEKAAADAKKKAEEKEKQKAAAEKAASVEVEKKAVEFKAPDISVPSFKAPDIDIPSFKAPDFKAPDIDIPSFKTPDLKVPDFKAPDFDVPSFKAPDISSFKAPEGLSVPKVDIPKVDIPSVSLPSVELPKVGLPSVSVPNPFGGGGSSSSSGDEFLEPQSVRDQRARDARKVFLAADSEAKTAEEAARQVRKAANEKLKEARLAKDEACKTKPGGRILCLRNPFSSGF